MVTRSRAREVLLFAALLLGIVTMHTLGHPSGHGSARSSGYSSYSSDEGSGGHGHSSSAMSHPLSSPPGRAQEHAAGASMTADMPPMNGMDPLSVCLAVLGGATLLLLLAAALGTPWASGATQPARAGLLRALWPHPPPQRTLLSRLSVLRI
ncbi:hypothetical protein [Streptomyces sp. NPDC050564]|uniref:hypothetical protein n=1 Tax=Streptomyces sp. NPDC050564 TaxID=3365631 RepID=UPI00379E27C1